MTVSVWQEMAVAPSKISHDIVVIGAGIVGSYLAGLLSKTGRDVAIIEARHPAAGASGRNAGMVLVGSRDSYSEAVNRFGRTTAQDLWKLTEDNVRNMANIADQFGIEHNASGASYIALDDNFANILRNSAEMLDQDGFDVEYIDGDPLNRGFRATLIQPSDFGTQPAELSTNLTSSSGATLYENDEVFTIGKEGSHLVIRTRRHIVTCEKAVLAVNAYAPLLDPFFQRLVEPARGQVLVTTPLPQMIDTLGLVNQSCYFRQLEDGRILIGGGRFQHIDQERTFADETTTNVQGFVGNFLAKYFPESDGLVDRRWAGIHGMTNDGLPIIGRLPHQKEVYFVVGFSGHGNSMGLVAGERTVELMLNGQDPGIFNIARLN